MRVELIRSNGFGRRERIVVGRLPVMIGSNPEMGIRLNDRHVSRVHCLLAEHEDQLLVRDLNSKRGTYVNGARVKEVPLEPGDRLLVGKTSFIVSIDDDDGPATYGGVSAKTLFVMSDKV